MVEKAVSCLLIIVATRRHISFYVIFEHIYNMHRSSDEKQECRPSACPKHHSCGIHIKSSPALKCGFVQPYWLARLLTMQDFSFYGNKTFQSAFIQILSPGASLLVSLLWTLLNSGCALIG